LGCCYCRICRRSHIRNAPKPILFNGRGNHLRMVTPPTLPTLPSPSERGMSGQLLIGHLKMVTPTSLPTYVGDALGPIIKIINWPKEASKPLCGFLRAYLLTLVSKESPLPSLPTLVGKCHTSLAKPTMYNRPQVDRGSGNFVDPPCPLKRSRGHAVSSFIFIGGS
jgi:hypothetical protein